MKGRGLLLFQCCFRLFGVLRTLSVIAAMPVPPMSRSAISMSSSAGGSPSDVYFFHALFEMKGFFPSASCLESWEAVSHLPL